MPKPSPHVEMDARSKQLVKNLRGTDLMPMLRKELRRSTASIAPDVRREARGLPSKTTGSRVGNPSLRRQVASAIKMKLRVSSREMMVAIIAVPKGDKSNLARALEGTIHWPVMVFGNPKTMHLQEEHPFFYRAIRRHEPNVARAMVDVMDEFERKI